VKVRAKISAGTAQVWFATMDAPSCR